MIALLLSVFSVFGFLAHLTKRYTTNHMASGWREICNYTLGVIYVFPLSTWMFIALKDDIKRSHTRFMVSYLLSFMAFGVGVVAGYRYGKDE